ncbi:MAG TPA: putative glycoside hydrolase, partial [Longimicrobiales bacterium]
MERIGRHKRTGIKLAVALVLGYGALALARGDDSDERRLPAVDPAGSRGAEAADPVEPPNVQKRLEPRQLEADASAGAPPPGALPWLAGGVVPAEPTSAGVAAAQDSAAPPTYVLPPLGEDVFPAAQAPRVARPKAVHGIYLNAWAAGSPRKRAKLIALAERTEINTFVIDVKDATGYVSYETGVAVARQIGADRDVRIHDVRALLDTLRAKGIYPIARIVAFKDPLLARRHPEWAIQEADGSVWQDHHGELWVDAFNRNVWDYNIALAREALLLGFAEVQWDYVRFPDVPSRYMRTAVYPARAGRKRAEAIREFLRYSSEQLADLNAPITADVFGLTVSANDDMGIGQSWSQMVDVADVLLPMVYPSHFAKGSYGIPEPNADPYRTILTALGHAVERTVGVPDAATIRPWLQDFTLGWPDYGAAEVRAQIEATYDAGLSEWILWNPGSDYTE